MAEAFSDADELIAEVARRYQEIRTYRDDGVVISRCLPGPNSNVPEFTTRTPFRTMFVRPDLFRFEFKAQTAPGKLRRSPSGTGR